ncbi:MAG TPA: plastocyanin/azurin family copper-binding protein [Vicinamibacterales bacterium]|jgi:plastocyanin
MYCVRIVLVALVLGFIAACGGSTSTPSTPSPQPAPAPSPSPGSSAATTITIPSGARTLGTAAFVPNPVTVSQGTVVTWSNTDSIVHDMVSDTGVFDSGLVSANGTVRVTFSTRGTFPYHCSLHPGMVGTIIVQ